MKRFTTFAIAIGCLIVWTASDVFAGRGGGGGGRGGGGGVSRGGGGGGGVSRGGGGGGGVSRGGGGGGSINRTPSFSQPSNSRPSVSSRPSTGSRPSVGTGGPSQLPSTGSRPNVGTGRPSQLPATGSRPGVGTRPEIGSRPSQLPATGSRPNVGTARPSQLPATSSRPGVGSRPPIASTRPDAGRVGAGNRPSNLPAAAGGALAGVGIANRIGDRPAATLPGLGDGRANISQLPANVRRDQLSNRLRGEGAVRDGIERPGQNANRDWNQVRNDWQDHRNDVRNDWQDYRDGVRNDWQNYRDDHFPWHRGWYWGYAAGNWNRWDYLWDRYPVASAVGLTWWGANSLGHRFGYNNYYNPYYTNTGRLQLCRANRDGKLYLGGRPTRRRTGGAFAGILG